MSMLQMKEKPFLFHAREMEKVERKNVTLKIRDEDGSTYNYVTSDVDWALRNLDVVSETV